MMNGKLFIDVLRKQALTQEMDIAMIIMKIHLKMKKIILVNISMTQKMKVGILTNWLLKTVGF